MLTFRMSKSCRFTASPKHRRKSRADFVQQTQRTQRFAVASGRFFLGKLSHNEVHVKSPCFPRRDNGSRCGSPEERNMILYVNQLYLWPFETKQTLSWPVCFLPDIWIWVSFITTSHRDQRLESWELDSGNSPTAASFRLVDYSNLPRDGYEDMSIP